MDVAPRAPVIREEDLGVQAAFVRHLIVQRLEQIWSTVAPHVDGTRIQEGMPADPRFVEAGIRVLDRLAKLYRLDQPARDPDQEAGTVKVDPAALVSSQLRELEARVREQGRAE